MTKQEQQLTQIISYASAALANDKTGHDLAHLKRVASLVEKLHQECDFDLFIALSAAYLHDVIDDKLFANPATQLAKLKEFLVALDLDATQITAIEDIITHMSFAHSLEQEVNLSIEGQIVQDADWLDAIGAIGITRAIYFGGAHHEKIYDLTMKPRQNMSKEEYRNLDNETIINHFYEKLLLLKNKLNTSAARKLAAHRHQVMLDFLSEFKAEWDGQR